MERRKDKLQEIYLAKMVANGMVTPHCQYKKSPKLRCNPVATN
jgi:hypothetical protein